PTDKPDPPRVVGAPAPGANMCRAGSHRGRCSYRQACPPRVVGAPCGCECVPDRIAPGAVLLQTSLPTSCCRSTLRVRMRARPVRTEAVLLQTDRAAGVYPARVQVEVRPNMGVPTKPRSLSTLSPS